ncbi:MAG: hypothetical protein IPM69_12360 [Ignavibacteria bacterium]|nr:hypothetical protein [Ignavibacteria bacterium]
MILLILARLTGCHTPKTPLIATYDIFHERTILASTPEIIEMYPVWAGYDPELDIQAFYKCRGRDTSCTPDVLHIRWILLLSRSKETTLSLANMVTPTIDNLYKPEWVHYHSGDSISITGDKWKQVIMIDSATNFTRTYTKTYEDKQLSNNSPTTYKTEEVTQYLYSTVSLEQLEKIADSRNLVITVGKDYKFNKPWKNKLFSLVEFNRLIREKHQK